ncbi:MAG: hypothetical protein ACO1OB_06445 [Archangium sp.]
MSLAFGVTTTGCGDPPCNSSTCPTGCCDSSDTCQSASQSNCGQLGNACVQCQLGQQCNLGICMGNNQFGGGSGSTGGGAGSTGGGAGSTGGGAGNTGGGAGSTGGGSGSTGGGAGSTGGGAGSTGGGAGSTGGGAGSTGGGAGSTGGGAGSTGGGAGTGGGSQPPACGPSNCAGCCSGTSCIMNPSVIACGTGGQTCQTCGNGDTCLSGECIPAAACDQTTCPNGCCDPMFGCTAGNTNSSCGWGGAQCQSCLLGPTCQSQACTTVAQFPGAACSSDSSCKANDGSSAAPTGTCQTPGTIWPNGYCLPPCANGTCATGTCLNFGSASAPNPRCAGNCTGPGTGQSNCRTGYVCLGLTGANGQTAPFGVCFPNCNNSVSQLCPSPSTCSSLGYCQ